VPNTNRCLIAHKACHLKLMFSVHGCQSCASFQYNESAVFKQMRCQFINEEIRSIGQGRLKGGNSDFGTALQKYLKLRNDFGESLVKAY
jgi:hypothetical protein